MKSIDWGNVVSRALWTAVQAFVSVFAVANLGSVEDLKGAATAGAVAAGAALISFVKTILTEAFGA
jgi:hypothetical protein